MLTLPPSVNLPNTITLIRLILCVIFAAAASFATREEPVGYGIALVVFIFAAISDFLDGYLARKLNLVTALGKLMDPLADKILVCTAFVYISVAGLAPVWATALIIAREFLVTGIRQIAVEKGEVIAADRLGKLKTIFQLTFCIMALVHLYLRDMEDPDAVSGLLRWLANPDNFFIYLALWPAVALTALSGANYFINARHLFFPRKT